MFRLSIDDDGVARLALDRPEARNAIPVAGWRALAERAKETAGAGARLLLLTGSHEAFCAGADLADFTAMRSNEAARADFRAAMRAGMGALRALPFPAIAHVEGPCYGAGVALAMACDLRVAGPGARFAITPAKMGISYPQEDIRRLVELVGPGQSARLLFTAAPIDAGEALRIGLAELAEPEEGIGSLVDSILANSADSLAALKRGIRLAAAGVESDAEQAWTFDALIGGEELARRLAERGKG